MLRYIYTTCSADISSSGAGAHSSSNLFAEATNLTLEQVDNLD